MTEHAPQSRLYFDITDLVQHATWHARVSGISRVVLNIVRDAVVTFGEGNVRCIFYDRRVADLVECTPAVVSQASDFDPEGLLFQVGLLRNWGMFPSHHQLQSYLQPYRTRHKAVRGLLKADVYLSSLLWKSRLTRMGLQRTRDRFSDLRRVPLRPVSPLAGGDTLLLLGANWTNKPIGDLVGAHARSGGRVVQLVHDLIPYRHPEYCVSAHVRRFREWLAQTLQTTVTYVCNSNCTAVDLEGYLVENGVSRHIVVVPLAHEFFGFGRNERVPVRPARFREWRPGGFVLCVGTIEIRKNGAMLLRAWTRLQAVLGDRLPLLVFAGGRGWMTEEFDARLGDDMDIQQRVRVVESPSDSELAWLYAHCRFTVFPSLYEGWGLPVGESAWFGKLCVASNSSSIPEVCGDLMDYVNPADVGDIVDKLHRATVDGDYLRCREERISSAPLRSWSQVVEDLGAFLAGPKVSSGVSRIVV